MYLLYNVLFLTSFTKKIKRSEELEVSAPFHCSLMKPAATELYSYLCGNNYLPMVENTFDEDNRRSTEAAGERRGGEGDATVMLPRTPTLHEKRWLAKFNQRQTKFGFPKLPIISNVTAKEMYHPFEFSKLLVAQVRIYHKV